MPTAKKKSLPGPVHKLPSDLGKAIASSKKAQNTWDNITPLARNEWICWVTSPKKAETRKHRIERGRVELGQGKKRPCCWPGCPHRRPSAKKWFK